MGRGTRGQEKKVSPQGKMGESTPSPQVPLSACLPDGTKKASDLDHLAMSKPFQALDKDRGSPFYCNSCFSPKSVSLHFLVSLESP